MSAIQFIIAGAQKAGTTALAHYLDQCDDVAVATGKEAHVFDSPEFDEANGAEWAERALTTFFPDDTEGVLRGDATPITLLHPTFIRRAADFSPSMRWVVVLRNPVDRAISHFHMERSRGVERLPMLLAFALEPWRLRGRRDDFSWVSPLRWASYLTRGDYRRQLDALYRHVPRAQVLILSSDRLREQPHVVVDEVRRFLGLPALSIHPLYAKKFEGQYTPPGPWSPARWYARWRLRAALRDGLYRGV